jgi:hypothetical protein
VRSGSTSSRARVSFGKNFARLRLWPDLPLRAPGGHDAAAESIAAIAFVDPTDAKSIQALQNDIKVSQT